MSLMALCDKKGCFLRDLEGVTLNEFNAWLAYYELKESKNA